MLKIGSLVDNKYRVLDIIGQGGMSVVYLARNEAANQSWAIKEVRKVGEENLEVKKNSLIAETEMLKKLHHPNLPRIIDVIETKDTYLVVMDYIEGNDLGEMLNEFGAQPQEKVIEWGKQLCDVLGYLHSRTPPIIYRDLKPANVMLKPDNKITLIDFGTAREIKVADANDTISLGTRGYAAPEQFGANAKTDARTDIYCLGATLYHLVTNHNPSTEPYVMEPIRKRIPSLDPGLETIILKCTQPNPNDRYQSCAELMYALEHYDEEGIEHKKKQVKKLILFFSSILLCILSIGTAVFGYSGAQQRKSENYFEFVKQARDENLTENERADLYFRAMAVSPGNYEAYNELLELFCNINEDDVNGDLSSYEHQSLTKIRTGLNSEEGGKSILVMPLETLKTTNSNEYFDFCYDVGMFYWYNYSTNDDNERKRVSNPWFRMICDDYDKYGGSWSESKYMISEMYFEIGSMLDNINNHKGRTDDKIDMFTKLWEDLSKLYSNASASDDTSAKLLSWTAICSTINDNYNFFASYVNDFSLNIEELLNNISNDYSKLKSSFTDVENTAYSEEISKLEIAYNTFKKTISVYKEQIDRTGG